MERSKGVITYDQKIKKESQEAHTIHYSHWGDGLFNIRIVCTLKWKSQYLQVHATKFIPEWPHAR